MILKVNDTDRFNLTMNLSIDWDRKNIEVTVCSTDKKKKMTTAKTFPAEDFNQAIDCFDQEEKRFLRGALK